MNLIPLESTTQYVSLFLIFSIVGILGESLFCFCWKLVQGQRFWDYKMANIFKGYSSWLNIIPWGMGGYLYVLIYEFILRFQSSSYEYPLAIAWGIIAFLFCVPFVIFFFREGKPIKSVFKATIILFLPLLFIASFHQVMFFFLILGSIVIGVLEYLYGKIMYQILGKKLWVYNILPRDRGHISLIAPFGFAVAGLLFVTVYQSLLVLF